MKPKDGGAVFLEQLQRRVDEFEARWETEEDYRFKGSGHRDQELLLMVKTLLAYLKESKNA